MCRTTPSSNTPVANTMAVTAPTYVLEESLSSQKLWKQTAGNRPPQPVEERAFFEQMWAQNFARSKVKYEIPVEVLTASTPISISPFNDDGFMGEDGGGNNLSNYNLAGPFNMKGVDGEGAADPASVKAAQADVAEATLNQHLASNGAVEMYFDPNRPKDYNLKTLGPHQHHHTLVNKKVKGVGEENDLTVVVRGDNVFGTTVSKSFPRVNEDGEPGDGIDTVSISIASYRVVEVRSTRLLSMSMNASSYEPLSFALLNCSPKNAASMHSTWSSSAMVTSETQLVFGNVTQTFQSLAGK